MTHLKRSTILVLSGLALVSFTAFEGEMTFAHPKKKGVSITMTSDVFHDFTKEWREKDYYYSGEGKDGFICSVLFYQLNKQEIKDQDHMRADSKIPAPSAIYPMYHFSLSSATKEFEKNSASWGDPDGDFLFRQTDIPEFQGQAVHQKNMFAYTMFGNDIYVSVHLSKVLCTPADSVVMRDVLETLKKKS